MVSALIPPLPLGADSVRVRHTEGLVHGFLTLKSDEGTVIADGELSQTARGTVVTSRLTFRFRDGSLHDETATFSQRGQFRLIRDHLVQKGPAFPRAMDVTIDVASGRVVVRYDDEGTPKIEDERMTLPADLANGLITTLLKNADPAAPPSFFSYVAATPKPRLVKLKISVAGRDQFRAGTIAHEAVHYVLKVDIGGLTGIVADVLNKVPPDSHVWILQGDAPAFIRGEQPFFQGAPLWRIDLASPSWPQSPRTN